MRYVSTEPLTFKTSKGEVRIKPGEPFKPSNPENLKILLLEGKVFQLDVSSWLDKLSDSERDIFKERAAIMQYDGGLEQEVAEVEAIKRIIEERVIAGKCDRCGRVAGCLLTSGMRKLCEVMEEKK